MHTNATKEKKTVTKKWQKRVYKNPITKTFFHHPQAKKQYRPRLFSNSNPTNFVHESNNIQVASSAQVKISTGNKNVKSSSLEQKQATIHHLRCEVCTAKKKKENKREKKKKKKKRTGGGGKKARNHGQFALRAWCSHFVSWSAWFSSPSVIHLSWMLQSTQEQAQLCLAFSRSGYVQKRTLSPASWGVAHDWWALSISAACAQSSDKWHISYSRPAYFKILQKQLPGSS